jgi:Rieske Fe-S protein
MTDLVLSRRGALRGTLAAAVGAVAGFLAVRGTAAGRGGRGTAAANDAPSPTEGARLLAAVDDVPPGGGLVLPEAQVVLTRTPDGELHAFSAVCTHQGCTVDSVADGTIDCACHGSRFDATTGAVAKGPATDPLPPVPVVVRSGEVFSS